MRNYEFIVKLPTENDLANSEYNIEYLGNEVLYEMCKKYPSHAVKEQIYAKLWLIGRSYSAALERNKSGNKDIYEKTIIKLIDNGFELDELIKGLLPIVDDYTMYSVLLAHKKLVDIFKESTNEDKRSLASKYLHFHRPDIFYIYDSNANSSVNACVKGSVFYPEGEYDREYFKFNKKVFALKVKIKEKYNRDLTPREIDNLLVNLYKNK